MNTQKRREQFLAQAKEADDYAAKAKDEELKASWRRIAEDYRALARMYHETRQD